MTFLAVVSHPDDDLLFLNPDIADAIRSGGQVVTVYVTAGQGSGTGLTAGERAYGRQRGIMDAYAYMAGHTPAGDQSEWTGELVTVNGKQVERYSLDGRVHLVWLALPDGQLAALDAGTPQLTVPIPDGLGAPTYGYNRADVVNTLVELIGAYQPSQVCTLDPWPEARYTPHDHTDHTASARIAGDAAVAAGVPALPYRGYSITAVPANLPPAVAADKRAIFDIYAAYDDDALPYGWCERMLYRWPRGADWVGYNADGRLQVFAVRAGRVVTWWQTDDWSWSQPKVLGTGPIAPGLSVGYDTDGRMEVFARRLSDHALVVIWQKSPSGPWASSWSSLGNHNAGQPNAAQMGVPTVVRHADGRLCVLVKNGGGGVSCRSQTAAGGSWGPWTDLGGTDVQDGLTAVVGPSGRIEVFAATTTGIAHWYQTAVNGPFKLHTSMPGQPAGSPPTALLQPDGRLLLAYRQAGGTGVVLTRQVEPDGSWLPPVVVPGPGGHGQVAAAVCSGQVWLACRDATGGVSATTLDADGLPEAWTAYGETCDVPALATVAGVPYLFTGGPAVRPLADDTWTALP
ncbi:PIG-L family deacetylase [Micromonospora orduensis]|uniref:PIG-L family deacetylase n=1 Tax=Micromonospora orduensis TaxID=1420891 RepID=UPI00340F6EFE